MTTISDLVPTFVNGPKPAACDECDLCCRVIGVEEIDKPRGHACPHLVAGKKGGGCCGIFERQPESCRMFFCGWRASQYLSPKHRMPITMRPDHCGVVIGPIDEENESKIYLNVDPGRPDSWKDPDVLEYIKTYIRNGVEVVLYVGDAATTFSLDSPTVVRSHVQAPDPEVI